MRPLVVAPLALVGAAWGIHTFPIPIMGQMAAHLAAGAGRWRTVGWKPLIRMASLAPSVILAVTALVVAAVTRINLALVALAALAAAVAAAVVYGSRIAPPVALAALAVLAAAAVAAVAFMVL